MHLLSNTSSIPDLSPNWKIRLGCLLLGLLAGLLRVTSVGADDLLDQPIRHLFVPLEEFDAVMARDKQGVLLKRQEFEALVADATRQSKTGSQPSGLVISSANYRGQIDGEQLRLTATIRFMNFERGWTEIQIPTDGLSVEKCQINGQPALAGWHGENPNILRVFTAQLGAGTLTLDLSARLAAIGSDLSTGFGVIPAASGELVITLPAGKFLLESGHNLPRSGPPDQPAEYRIALGGHRSTSLQITNRQATTRTDSLILASTAIQVSVAPGEVAWAAQAALQVIGRPIDKLVCTVPQSLEITGVDSTGLDSWELIDTPDDPTRTTITLAYRQPFDGNRSIEFRGVLKAATDTAWDVPTLDFNDITSQVGVATVRYPSGVRLRVGELDGVRTIVHQTTTAENGDALLHFQIWKPRFRLPFVTEPKTREVRAAISNLLDLNPIGLDFTSVINLQTRQAPLFDAEINLPASWQIRSLFVGNDPVPWQIIPQEAGVNQVRVTFPTPVPADGTVTLTINAGLEPDGWPVEDNPVQVGLPRLQLPQAGIVEGLYGITAEQALEVVPSDLVGLDSPSQSELALLGQKVAAYGRSVRLGFSLQDTGYRGVLNVSRKPARISSHASTFFRVDVDRLNSHIESTLTIEGGGTRRLMIDLPEAAGTDLRFKLSSLVTFAQESGGSPKLILIPGIKIVEQTAGPVEAGRRRWTLRLDRYLIGTQLLSVDIRAVKAGAGPFACPVMSVVGAERETGFAAVEASQEQFLTPVAADSTGQPLTKIDPINFPAAFYQPKEPIVSGFRYSRPGWALLVGEQRFDRAGVPTAIGHQLSLQTVLGRNGELQQQSDLAFTAIGIQNLKVRLPSGVDLWAVQVNQQPQPIRQQGDGLLVAVPQSGNAHERHTLTLFYRSQLTGPPGSDLTQAPPKFSVLDGQGAEQPLEILSQSWKLHHPNDWLVIDSPGAFQPTIDPDRDGWLARASSLMQAPKPQRVRDGIVVLAILFLAAWGIRKSLERFGWKRIIGAGAVCGILAGFFSLLLPAVQQARNVRYDVAALHTPAPTMAAPSPKWNRPMSGEEFSSPMEMDAIQATPNIANESAPVPLFDGTTTPPMDSRFGYRAISPERGRMNQARDEAKSESEGLVKDRAESQVQQREMSLKQPTLNDEKGGAVPTDPNFSVELPEAAGRVPQAAMPGGLGGLSDTLAAPSSPPTSQAGSGPYNGSAIDQHSLAAGAMGFGGMAAPTNGPSGWAAPAEKAALAAILPNAPGGLLSLALQLVTPADSTSRDFTYLGRSDTTPDLSVRFTSEDRSRDFTLFVMIVVWGAGWFTRRTSLAIRVIWSLLLVCGTLGVAPLLPAGAQPMIDGLFFGGVTVLGVTLLMRLGGWVCGRCCRRSICGASSPVISALLLLATVGIASSVRAEEPMAPKPAPAMPHVVLPYSGDDPSTADRVYLPQSLFLELWSKAHPEEATLPAGPVEGLIVEALHAATFEDAGKDSVVHVKSRMVVINLPEKQVSLPLPIREVALKSAVLDGQPASLQADGTGYRIVLDQPGTHILDVEFDVPAPMEGPAGRFTLKTHPTAAAKLSVQLPKIMGDRDLRVNGSTGLYRLSENADGPVLDTAVDRGGEITISWQPRAVRGAGNTIVHVDTGAAVVVDDVGFHLNHQFAYRVRQGALNEVSFEVPAALSIRELSGPDIGGWQLDEAQGMTRRLRVFLRRTVEDQTTIVLDLYAPLPVTHETQTLPVPEVIPMEATREIGQIGLFAASEFVLRPVDTTGASRVDLDKYQPVAAPHRPEGLPLAAFRFATRPVHLTVSLSRRQPETRCVAEHGVQIAPRKAEWASRLVFDLTGAPRPSVSIDLPPDYLLMDVAGADFINDWYDTPSEDGHRTLTIEFDQPRLGQVELLLTGQAPRKPEAVGIELLPPQPLAIEKLNTTLAVWVSDLYSATVRSAEGWKSTPPDQLSPELRQLRSSPIQFAFRAAAPVRTAASIDLSRQVAQLSGDQVTLVAVADDSIDYGLTFRWKITRAATDTFRFTSPAWFQGRLELTVPNVRQISTERTAEGELLWTIELIDPVRNQFLCTGVVTLPPASNDLLGLPNIAFLGPDVAGKHVPLESQRKAAIVVNRSQSQLVAVDEQLIRKIPQDQLPLVVESSLLDQALAITELSPTMAYPQWKLVRGNTQESGRATVIGSDLLTALDWDGTWRTQAIYTVRNRGQQFLGLELPAGARLMSVFVKGRPSRTVMTQLQERMIHLVPLPQTSMVDLSFEVQITLFGQLANPLQDGWSPSRQEVSLPAPSVVTRNDSPDFGLTVAHTSWKVLTPDKLDATLVNDRSRSNVDQLSGDDSFVSPETARLERLQSDYQEMVRVLKHFEGDQSRQMQCVDNLKQLDLALLSYQGDRRLSETYARNSKLQSFNEQIRNDIATAIMNCPSTPADGEPSSVTSPARVSNNRDFIIGQNGLNFTKNSAFVLEPEMNLEFKGKEVAGKKSESLARRSGKADNGRGALRKQLEDQSYSNAGQGLQAKPAAQPAAPNGTDDLVQLNINGVDGNQIVQQFDQSGQFFRQPAAVRFNDGAFGGMGGGVDGFVTGGDPSGTTVTGTTGPVPRWTQPGGLSLPISVPLVGTESVFSKVGGTPQLTLSLRPRQAWTTSLTSVWSIAWIVLALWLARRIWSASQGGSFRPVLAILACLGAVGYLLLPAPLSVMSLLVFAVSLLVFMLTSVRRATVD